TQPALVVLPWNSISTCFLYAPHPVYFKIELWSRTNRSSTPEHFGYILVQNRTVRHGTFMPVERNQRGGSPIDRVRQQTERRALEQAKRVPWKRLAEAADEYTDWQVFTLWLRAVVEAAKCIPAMVEHELESRA